MSMHLQSLIFVCWGLIMSNFGAIILNSTLQHIGEKPITVNNTLNFVTQRNSRQLWKNTLVTFPSASSENWKPISVNFSNISKTNIRTSQQMETNCKNCLKKPNYYKVNITNFSAQPDVKEAFESEMERLRIEEIKSKILKKLRMVDQPNVTMLRSMLPEPLQVGELRYFFNEFNKRLHDEEDDYYGKTEHIIVIAENVDYPICHMYHHDPAGCFHFKLTNDIMNQKISSAELWVYKLRDKRDIYNQTYCITEIQTLNYNATPRMAARRNNIVSIRDTALKNGWIKFDLTTTVQRWLFNPRKSMHKLRISCKTCGMDIHEIPVSNDPGEKPFIVINFKTEEHQKRSRRNGMCEPDSTNCCKHSYFVNFTDIGWSNWIVAPEGYWANFCKGLCMTDLTNNNDHYSTIIQLMRSLSPAQLSEITPCCSPKKLSPMSMLYTTSGGNFIYNTLPNMIVESCGCNL